MSESGVLQKCSIENQKSHMVSEITNVTRDRPTINKLPCDCRPMLEFAFTLEGYAGAFGRSYTQDISANVL